MPTWFQDVSVQRCRGSETCCHKRDAEVNRSTPTKRPGGLVEADEARGSKRTGSSFVIFALRAAQTSHFPFVKANCKGRGPAICRLFQNPRDSDVRHPCSPFAWDPEILVWYLRQRHQSTVAPRQRPLRSFRARGEWKAFQGFAPDLQNQCCR